ncbi:hypothetical protein [Candidatus Reidiella endopervernicosa]|uniref:hypothetical protein n=1 Tax=Candidatus Reidiella endopervernicosa TaxID=2738883 RepID=UPI0026D696E4|nr:hypothetical protein [Candidatus Reidiella endopervernicosa]
MHYVLIILILLTILVGPNFWVRYVVRRHSYQREDIPGSGGELARHLLDRYKL